jgi:hypothetical protein
MVNATASGGRLRKAVDVVLMTSLLFVTATEVFGIAAQFWVTDGGLTALTAEVSSGAPVSCAKVGIPMQIASNPMSQLVFTKHTALLNKVGWCLLIAIADVNVLLFILSTPLASFFGSEGRTPPTPRPRFHKFGKHFRDRQVEEIFVELLLQQEEWFLSFASFCLALWAVLPQYRLFWSDSP